MLAYAYSGVDTNCDERHLSNRRGSLPFGSSNSRTRRLFSHTQPVKAVSNDTTPEASTVKQSAITDFFYPRPSTGHASNVTQRVSPDHSFIKPRPLVRLAEVPALFEV